jgi:endonuclease/exonuclease/phosphatase family metal-dependent hydrolase
MRVMTWNLWWQYGPWRDRAAAILSVVKEQAADVLLLQEVWGAGGTSSAHELASALGFDAAITDRTIPPDSGAAGEQAGIHNAIVSRWPLHDAVSHPLPGITGSPGHRRVLTAAVDAPSGRWQFASTHLDYRFDDSAVRQMQAEALLRIVAGLRGDPDADPPVVVGGDFNAVPDSDEIRMVTGRRAAPVRNLVLTDSWEQVGEGSGHTWRGDNPYQASSSWPNRRLDYVFVSWPRPKPLGNPRRAWLAGLDAVDGVWPSDHAAVVVDLHDQ